MLNLKGVINFYFGGGGGFVKLSRSSWEMKFIIPIDQRIKIVNLFEFWGIFGWVNIICPQLLWVLNLVSSLFSTKRGHWLHNKLLKHSRLGIVRYFELFVCLFVEIQIHSFTLFFDLIQQSTFCGCASWCSLWLRFIETSNEQVSSHRNITSLFTFWESVLLVRNTYTHTHKHTHTRTNTHTQTHTRTNMHTQIQHTHTIHLTYHHYYYYHQY
jgi:hypothetical protein